MSSMIYLLILSEGRPPFQKKSWDPAPEVPHANPKKTRATATTLGFALVWFLGSQSHWPRFNNADTHGIMLQKQKRYAKMIKSIAEKRSQERLPCLQTMAAGGTARSSFLRYLTCLPPEPT